MSQLRFKSATLANTLALRPATRPLMIVCAQGRFFSYTNCVQGKEWKNGCSKGYIYKPKGLIEPKWDELQKMMKWRSLSFNEYFQSIFGSPDPRMAKREWYQWVKATPDRYTREEIRAKELEAIHREIHESLRFIEEWAKNYSNLCAKMAMKKVGEVLGGNVTGQTLFEEHREGDPVLDAQLETRMRSYVDRMLNAARLSEETGETITVPKFGSVSDLRRQSRERYGSTFKEAEGLAEYKKKYSDLMPPAEEAADPAGRVYDPISQRMVPVAGGAGEGVKAPKEGEMEESEEAKKKGPSEGGEDDKSKVRSNEMWPNTQHRDYMLRIEHMKKTLKIWTEQKTGTSSEACSSPLAEATKDAIQRPLLTNFDRETETAESGPLMLGHGEERGEVRGDLRGDGGSAGEGNGNHKEKLYDLTRDVKNTKVTPQTQGSSRCSPSPSVNSVPSALSSKSATQIEALSAGKDTVLADSGSASIPESITNYATKVAEISKALDTLSSMNRDQGSGGNSVTSVPQSITEFNAKIAELKRTLETLNPVLEQSNAKSGSPKSDPPKPSPSPVPRLQSALDRIASTPRSRPNISPSGESLGNATAELRISPDPLQHEQSASPEAQISSSPALDTEPQPKTVYKVLAYDSGNDILTTSITTTPPRPGCQESSLSLPDALSLLSNPSKFVPHLPANFEPVLSSANLLVLRETPDIGALEGPVGDANNDVEPLPHVLNQERRDVNPVDGTTAPFPGAAVGNYASPTGFVNYNQLSPVSGDQPLDSEATAQLKEKYHANQHDEETHERDREQSGGGRHRSGRRSHGRGERRSHGGAASVAKTAIVGVSACYIAGVAGEVVEPRR
ncbi:hypothetical protein BU16DRAFT_567721 [Lophium mytilinum]|uniref:Uncharacterized protein n=1 Tax=Lophium mytilinum TaxID=390894 RepID=A0A6A6QAQ6_9PEZI|nr:hypothetical protein BU16DRAFT_567721 [Lophium mytilinum]